MHRGKIGGGKKGVGKSLFWEHYANEYTRLENDDQVALIGDIDGNCLIDQIASFVYEVKRIKNSEIQPEGKPGNSINPMFLKEFFEETSGSKNYSVNAEISAKCNHGPILSALNNQIRDMGLTSEKNRYIDLFVGRNKKSPILFELKTDCDSSSIYSAIGQLNYYSIGLLNVTPMLVAVMPHEISDEVKYKIEKLGIKVITFFSAGNEYKFNGLKELLG